MKKSLMLLLSAFLLASCGNADQKEPTDEQDTTVSDEQETTEPSNQETKDEEDEAKDEAKDESLQDGDYVEQDQLSSFEESDVLSKHIDLDQYKVTLQTENKGNRILFFTNDAGEKEYKSIYIKKEQRIKIIQLKDDDLLVNEKLNTSSKNDTTKSPGKAEKNEDVALKDFEEYSTLQKHIDLGEYTSNIEVDQKSKRVILFEDDKQKKHYKSVYLPQKKHLKIIDLQSDKLLFNDTVQ